MHKIISMGKHIKTYNVALHSHVHWEVIYCTSGTGTFVFSDGTSMAYAKNDAVIIPPNIMHSNLSDNGFTNIYLAFDATTFPLKSPFKIFDNENRPIFSAISQAYYFFNSDIDNKDNVVTSLGDLIANYLIAFSKRERLSSSVERLRNAIISSFSDESFSLKTFIRNEPHNPDYLRKLFKRETGQSPLEFLTMTKINFAKKLLHNHGVSNFNVNEIAQMCGYQDAFYFSRIFKKVTGLSPKRYAVSGLEKK